MTGLLAALLAKQGDAGVKWGPNPYPAPEPPRPMLSQMFHVEPGNLDKFYGPRPSGMVDQIDDGVAAIVDPETGRVINMSAAALPPGSRSGSWVKDRQRVAAPPSRAAEIRRRLSADDNGEDIKL